ncbi:MAG: hypothetical protein JW910_11380 [Anaerolineae bacterium]|nr:hypothetical protein [Anaerolineae bacterium]
MLQSVATSTLRRENLDGGRIVLFSLADTTPETLSAWTHAVLDCLRGANNGTPQFVHDFSATDLTMTPFLRKEITQMAKSEPGGGADCAFIIPPGEQGLMLQVLVNRLTAQQRQRQRKFFFKREQGLAWLREQSNGNGNGNGKAY